MVRPRLKRVLSVTASSEAGVYFARIEAIDLNGFASTHDFCSRPDDSFGLGPDVRAAINAWLAAGKPVLPRS